MEKAVEVPVEVPGEAPATIMRPAAKGRPKQVGLQMPAEPGKERLVHQQPKVDPPVHKNLNVLVPALNLMLDSAKVHLKRVLAGQAGQVRTMLTTLLRSYGLVWPCLILLPARQSLTRRSLCTGLRP